MDPRNRPQILVIAHPPMIGGSKTTDLHFDNPNILRGITSSRKPGTHSILYGIDSSRALRCSGVSRLRSTRTVYPPTSFFFSTYIQSLILSLFTLILSPALTVFTSMGSLLIDPSN